MAAVSRYGEEDFVKGKSSPGHRQVQCGAEEAHFGSSLSASALRKIVKSCQTFLKRVEGPLALELFEVIVKVSSVISTSKPFFAGSCILYKKDGQCRATQNSKAASSFIDGLLELALEGKESLYSHCSPSTRLLLWRLQPQLLKQDLSNLLQKTAERPLLPLKTELQERHEWRNLTVGMAFGPDVFVEARRLLNTWLLSSGAPCIWEVKAELGAAIKDVLERPCSWSLSVEAGANLPPLPTFYPHALQSSLIILARPPTWSGLRELVSKLDHEGSLVTGCRFSLDEEDFLSKAPKSGLEFGGPGARNSTELASGLGSVSFLQDSLWALLMDFPLWLQFASLSLFQRHAEGLARSDHQEIAPRYIAWLISPHNKKLRELVVRMLVEMANSWLCIEDSNRSVFVAEENRFESFATKRKILTVENLNKHKPANALLKTADMELENATTQHMSGKIDQHRSANLSKEAILTVQQWLVSFQRSCHVIDSLLSQVTENCIDFSTGMVSGNGHQAKRRLHTNGDGAGFEVSLEGDETGTIQLVTGSCYNRMSTWSLHTNEDGAGFEVSIEGGKTGTIVDAFTSQSVTGSCYNRMSTFLYSLPLAALASSPGLHNDAVACLVLQFIISKCDCLICGRDESGVQRGGKITVFDYDVHSCQPRNTGKKVREPAHRTEDFKDLCSASIPSDCPIHASWVTGAATIFKFLETLDLQEGSEFINGNYGSGWLCGFKEVIGKQLIECIKCWSTHADVHHFTLLDDLHSRASLWATQAGLETNTVGTFNKVLQELDILIASSLAAS